MNKYYKIAAILLVSFTAYFYYIGSVVMGYMFNDFPNSESNILLVVTIPALICMLSSYLANPLMQKLNKKYIAVAAVSLNMVGGLAIALIGAKSLLVCVIAAGITGFATGLILPINYSVLLDIADERDRDKVIGWADASATIGMAVSCFLAGLLAKDGLWQRSYLVFLFCVIVLVTTLLAYPNSFPKADEPSTAVETDIGQKSGINRIPTAVIAVLILKFISGVFYMASGYWGSDYVINEAGIGSSALVGTTSSLTHILGALSAAFAFIMLRKFKGYTIPIFLLLLAAFTGLMPMFPNATVYFLLAVLVGVPGPIVNAVTATTTGMACKGSAVAKVTSWYVIAMFAGEFLCAYVVPACSTLVFGNALASSNLYIAGVVLAIVALIEIPFAKKVYVLSEKNKNEAKS